MLVTMGNKYSDEEVNRLIKVLKCEDKKSISIKELVFYLGSQKGKF